MPVEGERGEENRREKREERRCKGVGWGAHNSAEGVAWGRARLLRISLWGV